MNEEHKLPEQIFPVEYAGFWDFSIDGKYGDSVINVEDYPNAEQIAIAISKRYNNHAQLVASLEKLVSFAPDIKTMPVTTDFDNGLFTAIQEAEVTLKLVKEIKP